MDKTRQSKPDEQLVHLVECARRARRHRSKVWCASDDLELKQATDIDLYVAVRHLQDYLVETTALTSRQAYEEAVRLSVPLSRPSLRLSVNPSVAPRGRLREASGRQGRL